MLKTINFTGTAPARERITLVSRRIAFPYQTREILVTFPAGCINLLQLSFHHSFDPYAPTTEPPADYSFLAENGQEGYVVGEAIQKRLFHVVECPEAGSYLKVHANNEDYYAHTIDVQMTIDSMDHGED